MLRVDVTIKNASKIPLLGVKNEPSPYIIMECEQMSYTTPIAKYSQNPIWNYHTLIEAKKPTSYVHFYIYNNNPNAVDELLAYAKVEFGELMTRTNSQYKLRLMNSLEEPINSFLFLQHYDANPADLYLPLGERTSIMLRIINNPPADFYFTCQYGQASFNLSEELRENAFRYSPKYDRIRCVLKGPSNAGSMESEFLIGNIGLNNCITLRFYDTRQDYVIFLATSIVVNGLLPENYNILNAKITDVSKSNGKKNNNYRVRLFGPLNQNVFDEKAECQLYVENNSQVLVQYFEQAETLEGVEPYCSFRIPMNSLNWSSQTLDCTHQLKYFDSFKNLQTIISLKFVIRKSFELSKIMPKLNTTENTYDIDSTLQLEQIKFQNCFLFEVIKNNVVLLFHADVRGVVTAFPKFSIGQSKTEYTISTRECLREGGRGAFYLINLDQQFSESTTKSIQNSIIFKIPVDEPNKLEVSKIEYNSKFLAFAKKASVVSICKKFNQMVHDDLLQLKVKSKFTGSTRKGILKVINVKASGSFGKVSALISVDSASKQMIGQIGNYLIEKPHIFYASQGAIKVRVRLEGINAGTDPNKGGQDYQICYYGSFADFFGTPTDRKTYSQELKISPTHKLTIIYSFDTTEKLVELPIKINNFQFLEPSNNINISLKRAFVSVNAKTYKFRISRGGYAYQSHSYPCHNNKIYFQNSERLTLRMQNGEEVNPIFISAYSHDEDDGLLIYNGYINVSDVVGKGEYEILLVYEKEQKRKEIYFVMEVLHSSPFLAGDGSGLVKLAKISANTSSPLFRTIYKHYLLVKVNGFQYDIYECTISEQSLTLKAAINLRRTDALIFQLYSSYKAISKELFNATQKELIGCGNAIWEEVEENAAFVLNYYPKKEGQLKFTKNHLIIQESSYKLYLYYTMEKTKLEPRIEGLKLKPTYTEIDVLNRGVLNLFLKEYCPLEIDSKIISVEIKSLNLQMSSQSNFKINKSHILRAENMQFELEAALTMKDGEKYRRVSALASVKLRGNHYKINQPNSIIIYFKPYFYLTANFLIFHNKFVSVPQGDLLIREVSTRGLKIDRFEVAYSPQPDNQNAQNSVLFKKEGVQIKNCDMGIKTTSEINTLIFSFQGKGFKIKQRVCLAQLNIDRYEEQFVYERQLLVAGESLILTLKVNYNCIKQVKQQQQSIKYQLNNSQQIEVAYDSDSYNTFTANKQKSQVPSKTQGFLIQILLGSELTVGTKQVHILSEGNDPIILNPSVSNSSQFVTYTNKYLQIKNIKIINRDFIDKPVEPLGKQKGLLKFMVDQNPKLICTLAQNSCTISNIGNENWAFRLNFHRLIALSKKRLLSLMNTPNDEILTKQLGLLVRHGSQHHFIRNLNEFGSMNELKEQVLQFGYDNNCNILEIFLIIDNCFNNNFKKDVDKITSNWMEFFPISYGVINISNITPDSMFGFQLQPLENTTNNLEKAINKIVVREENVFCLCSMSFTKKSWGFITIKLIGCTTLNFTNKVENIFIYFKIQIQDSNRAVICSLSTEARPVSKSQNIEFTNNFVNFLFIQQNIDSHYNIKITGFILDNSNHYAFIEKRQEITDYFQKRGKQELNVQVKANETNNLCKNTFQISLELCNSIKPSQKQNLIEKAKSINSVDALSFREMGNLEFFQRLLGCQQLSHFNECLQQIKESYIYVEDPQYSSFILLVQYLSYNFDSKLIGEICEIIHLNLLKCPQIITDLETEGVTQTLYEYFRLICQRERKKVPSKVIKVSNQQYLNVLAKFKEKKDLPTLREALQLQMYLLYTSDQLLASLSAKNNEMVLNIINILLKYSKIIKDSLARDMAEWIQMFGFTTEQKQFQLFVLVFKNSILYGSELTLQNLHRFIQILLQRFFGLSIVFEFWQMLQDKDEQIRIYESISGKYQGQLEKNSVETCRGLKMMLSHILSAKNNELVERLQKAHQPVIKILMGNASKSPDIIVLSSHFDFLTYLLELKLLTEPTKNEIAVLLKAKMEGIKDGSAKMILSNYAPKFTKAKNTKAVSNNNKKEGLGEQMASKAGFYKKYLITSD